MIGGLIVALKKNYPILTIAGTSSYRKFSILNKGIIMIVKKALYLDWSESTCTPAKNPWECSNVSTTNRCIVIIKIKILFGGEAE